jgi:hypothetical protein
MLASVRARLRCSGSRLPYSSIACEEMPQRQIVAAFPPVHAAVTRLNVAARNVVVRLAQHGVGFAEQLQRVFGAALLEQKPAFGHPHRRRHRFHARFGRQRTPSAA